MQNLTIELWKLFQSLNLQTVTFLRNAVDHASTEQNNSIYSRELLNIAKRTEKKFHWKQTGR